MYDDILIPTDGSDVAENAIDHAIDLAEKYDATLHALYVVDVDAVNVSLGTEQVQRIKDGKFDEMPELRKVAEDATGSVVERGEARGLEVTTSITGGQPHRQIANYADEAGIDLVVIGSHGRSGVRRALLGSVTERVLRTTTVPVLVVDARKE